MTTITLHYEITLDGLPAKTLQLRRPKVKDMLSVDKPGRSDAEKEIHLFANLCEVPMDTLLELDLSDYQQLQAAYHDFLC